jgi:imidazolonepropionase-like amidohydrolase
MQSRDHDYALTGATLVDGTGQLPLQNATILVQVRKIVCVGPKDQIEIPSAVRTHDLRGKTLMPGLITVLSCQVLGSWPRVLWA